MCQVDPGWFRAKAQNNAVWMQEYSDKQLVSVLFVHSVAQDRHESVPDGKDYFI
jgi:hypothetical protein